MIVVVPKTPAMCLQELDFAPPPAEQKLLFGGRLLVDDTQTLSDLDIFGETCIMCVSQPRPVAAGPEGGGGAAAAPAEPAAAAAAEPDDAVRGAGAEPVEPVAVPVPAQAGERVFGDGDGWSLDCEC